MTSSPRRAEEAMEGPFRGPERLALALPLTAALGLTVVMAATAVGESTPFVALTAAAGFVFCGAAPIALLQTYVGRPLRVALAHLRAARDGVAPPRVAPAGGVIADLVAVARDIHAGRAHADQVRAGVALCANMAAAGDEAIRAFRLQCEELAETTAGERPWRDAMQAQFAEIADGLKALKAAAPAPPVDNGVERIEHMLVYLAETLERRESPAEGEDRVEAALTDIMRLIGREAQALQDAVAAAALDVRNDVAGAEAHGKAAHARQQERWETLEARVLTRLAEGSDDARVIEAIRSEAETTRLALRDRPEPAETFREAMAGLGRVAEDLRAQGHAQTGRLDAMEARLVAERSDKEAVALAALAKCADKMRNALDRFDVLAAAAASTATQQTDDLCAAVRALEGEVAGICERLGAPHVPAPPEPSEAQGEADAAGAAPRFDALFDDLARRLGERLDALDAKTLLSATRDLAAVQARCESFARQIAMSAAALAALAERDGLNFEALRAAVAGADATVAMPAQASPGDAKLGAWGESLQTVVAQAEDAHVRLGESLIPLDALAPAITALHVLTQALEASATQISTGVEGLQAFALVGLKSLAEGEPRRERILTEDVAPALAERQAGMSETEPNPSFDPHLADLGLRDDEEMQALRSAVSELIALGA